MTEFLGITSLTPVMTHASTIQVLEPAILLDGRQSVQMTAEMGKCKQFKENSVMTITKMTEMDVPLPVNQSLVILATSLL